MIKSNETLKKDVENSLDFYPSIKSKNIIVKVDNGIVTLSGSVESYYEKTVAQTAAKKVGGVRGVVDEIEVGFGLGLQRNDEEIAKAALRSLEADATLPRDAIKIVVKHGVIELSGEVNWYYQRQRALEDVKYLFGVKNVLNYITIKPTVAVNPEHVTKKIISEFQRKASFDARHIKVKTENSTIILEGQVRSWAEYDDALDAVWAIPGVTKVDADKLEVGYF